MRVYNPGDIVGPYTLISKIEQGKWKCKCNICGSYVDVFTSNMKRQRMCRFCRNIFISKPRKDLTGKRFGRLVITGYIGNSKWLCLCDCGNDIIASTDHLMSGHTRSCGCYQKERTSESRLNDLSGQKFGLLTVLHRIDDYISPKGKALTQYRCRCDCGTVVDVLATNLLTDNTRSCGCIGDSYGEYFIKNYLNNHHVRFQIEYSFPDLRSPDGGLLRFDFAIVNEAGEVVCLLEFHGEQHFYDEERASQTSFGRMQREVTDNIKADYCKERNIKLYVIRFDEDVESKMDEILEEIKNA